MKKSLSILILFTVLFLFILTTVVSAADLDTLEITLNKATVNPDQTVTIQINYGQELGAATFDVDYDTALLTFEGSTGTTSTSDVSGVVTATFVDSTGGDNPSTGMTLTFKAKTGITTSNPTQFLITATGLANPDGSVQFEDILVPIVKDLIVEPAYESYKITITHTGTIMPNVEHPIDVNISSAMGRSYDHLRLVAEVTKPDGSTVQLLGTDNANLEHDVILSGWGDAAGFGLGGAVNETYHFRGLFSHNGNYTLTLNLIDRDNSDAVIATGAATLTVGVTTEEIVEEEVKEEVKEELPEELPATGMNDYAILIMIFIVTAIAYVVTSRKK